MLKSRAYDSKFSVVCGTYTDYFFFILSPAHRTSVPKPLKFLHPHYEKIKEVQGKITDAKTKVCFLFPFVQPWK